MINSNFCTWSLKTGENKSKGGRKEARKEESWSRKGTSWCVSRSCPRVPSLWSRGAQPRSGRSYLRGLLRTLFIFLWKWEICQKNVQGPHFPKGFQNFKATKLDTFDFGMNSSPKTQTKPRLCIQLGVNHPTDGECTFRNESGEPSELQRL